MNINITNVNGNQNATASGQQSTATVTTINHGIDAAALKLALENLLPALRGLPETAAPKAREELAKLEGEIREQAKKPDENRSALGKLFAKAKGIAEYVTAGETIVKYAEMAKQALGGAE